MRPIEPLQVAPTETVLRVQKILAKADVTAFVYTCGVNQFDFVEK
jgi:hypothetical protein